MSKRNWMRVLAAFLALGLFAAACGDDDTDSDTSEEEGAGEEGAGEEGSLVGICPNPLVIQTDWFPEPEHGYTYNLIGPDGDLDADAGIYSGPLADTGITLEIRAGGPYLSTSSPAAQFYADDDIFMAYVDTATSMAHSGDLPVVAVFAPFEVGPQILMWDPEKFDFESFEDIGASGAPVLYFEGGAYMNYLLGTGLLSEDQIDASYDGSTARFITEDVVQQGFASVEPWKYENLVEGFMKDTDFILVHDSGFEIYEGSLSVKPESITESAECLEKLVPIMQQSQVDFMNDPVAMNARLTKIVEDLASFWTASDESHAAGVVAMKELGLVSDGPDSIVGNMEADRIQSLIDTYLPFLEELGNEGFKEGLQADEIFTNQFIDESIGLGF